MKLKTLFSTLALLALSAVAQASAITYPGPTIVDDAGAKVTPTSLTVASVTDLDGNAIASPGAVAHFAGSNSSVVYDAAAKGEAWITLTPVLNGHTFVNNPVVIFCSVDSSTLAATGTKATAIQAKTDLIGTTSLLTANDEAALNRFYAMTTAQNVYLNSAFPSPTPLTQNDIDSTFVTKIAAGVLGAAASSYNANGTIGAKINSGGSGGGASASDIAAAVWADPHGKKITSYVAGRFAFNPTTGLMQLYDADSDTLLYSFTLTHVGTNTTGRTKGQ